MHFVQNIIFFLSLFVSISMNCATRMKELKSTQNENDSNSTSGEWLRTASQIIAPINPRIWGKNKGGRVVIIKGTLVNNENADTVAMAAIKFGSVLVYQVSHGVAPPSNSRHINLGDFEYVNLNHAFTGMISRLITVHSLVVGPAYEGDFFAQNLTLRLIRYINKNAKRFTHVTLILEGKSINMLLYHSDLLQNYPGMIFIVSRGSEIKKLTYARFNNLEVGWENENTLKETVSKINPKAVLILTRKVHKIVTAEKIYQCSTPNYLQFNGAEDDILLGLLSMISFWGNLYKGKFQKFDLSPKIYVAYSACAITRLCSNFAFENKKNDTPANNMLNQIRNATKYYFPSCKIN